MILPLHRVFYEIENMDTKERDFLFIKNVLRVRRANIFDLHDAEWAKDKIYLQFILKDDIRYGFFLHHSQWAIFYGGLPHPPKIYCVSPQKHNYGQPQNDDERLVIANPK